jgi:hypothetical protein
VGIVPGGAADEARAINECTHADLAALHALLTHLIDAPGAKPEALKLATEISDAMIRDNSALQLWRNSVDSFNTAEVIYPRWSTLTLILWTALLLLTTCLPVLSARILPRIVREKPRGDNTGTGRPS